MNDNQTKKFCNSILFLKRIKETVINSKTTNNRTDNELLCCQKLDNDKISDEKILAQNNTQRSEKKLIGQRKTSSTWWERNWYIRNENLKDNIKVGNV